MIALLLGLILSAQAHVTSVECRALYNACLSQADVIIKPLPIDPTPVPEPIKPDWQCYLDRYDDVRGAGRYTQGWALRHWQHPGWGGRKQGRKWGCEAVSEPSGDVLRANRWHHVNHASGSGFGTAVSLCNGDEAERVELAGESWVKHGRLDKGREIWFTPSRKTGLEGELRITLDDGTVIESDIRGSSGMTEGDC